jgi:hypothetical protein
MSDDEKRTPKQWTEYLSMENNPVSLDEYVAGCVSRLLGATVEATLAAQHTEGMVGALDDFAAIMADRAGIPYARSGGERARLARDRADARAELGAAERAALGEQEQP